MTSEQACREYQPEPLAEHTQVVLYKASDSYQQVPADYGWNGLLPGSIQVLEVDANHLSIIEPDCIATIVARMSGSHAAGEVKPVLA